eukprot:3009721-Pleurochrysis_carterae.AAC.3
MLSEKINCTTSIIPVDSSPFRSPQAVHTVLARHFAGKEVVEIGTRNGDGIECFARVATKATAVELSRPYCVKLLQRSEILAKQTGRNFSVVCNKYQVGMPESFDFITWWQQAPHLSNQGILRDIRAIAAQRPLRVGAQAVALFDMGWPADRASWRQLRNEALWKETIFFDERELCFLKRLPA